MENKLDTILKALSPYKAGSANISLTDLYLKTKIVIQSEGELRRLLRDLKEQGLIQGDESCSKVAILPKGEIKITQGGYLQEKDRGENLYNISIQSGRDAKVVKTLTKWMFLVSILTLIVAIITLIVTVFQ